MIYEVLQHALMITGFVFVMMLIVEYLNVVTRGRWQETFSNRPWGQYLFAAVLGATPGCLGAFAVVTMYSHRVLSLGALIAAMVATSGDEAFVMLAMFPQKALFLTAVLIVLGFLAGWLVDFIQKKVKVFESPACDSLTLHEYETCECFRISLVIQQWRELSLARGGLVAFLLLFIGGVASGWIGPPEWNWIRVTITMSVAVGLFIIATVPEHFLQEHLWRHVARKHTMRIFLWTFGALLATHVLTESLHLESLLSENRLVVLGIACLVGIIPESGPHLIFVTLFAKGAIPFGTLLASSVVQDGHGMLPLLAHSQRAFAVVKIANLVVGVAAGLVAYLVAL